MAIKIFEKFAPRANPADGDYPYGSIKNESVPGAKDGTPLDAVWANDYAGTDAELFAQAGIVPNGQPDKLGASQRVDAISKICGRVFANVDAMVAFNGHKLGNVYLVEDYYGGDTPNNSGALIFKVVPSGTGTHDGGKFIDVDANFQLEQNLKTPYQVEAWGAQAGVDTINELKAANNYAASGGGRLLFGDKIYKISETFPLKTNCAYEGSASIAVNFPASSSRGTVLEWIGEAPYTPMRDDTLDDSTSLWTAIDSSLTFDTDHYVVTYVANTQYVYRSLPNLVEGKTYRLTFSIKDGASSGVPVTIYARDTGTSGTAVLSESYTTTSKWVEYTHHFVAGASTSALSLFSTMTSAGSYLLKDITVVECQSIVSEYNAQNVNIKNITLLGDYDYTLNLTTQPTGLIGFDIESFDGALNSRRGTYENCGVFNCHTGIAMSPRVKDSGNVDGYIFDHIDIFECYTGVSTYSRFIAYTKMTSFSLSYDHTGFDIKRASWIDFKDSAGACLLGYNIRPSHPASMFRFYGMSGVINMSGCESENAPADQLYSHQIMLTGDTQKLTPTNIIGNDFGNSLEVDIYNPTLNIHGNWFHINAPINLNWAGSIINTFGNLVNSAINDNGGGSIINDFGSITYLPKVSFNWDIPSINTASRKTTIIAYPGASLGDFAIISCDQSLPEIEIDAHVSSSGNVTVIATNLSGATQNPPELSFRLQVIKSRA